MGTEGHLRCRRRQWQPTRAPGSLTALHRVPSRGQGSSPPGDNSRHDTRGDALLVSETAAVVILAAGEGTRMRSRAPKVLHTLSGRSLLGHAISAASDLDPQRLVVVVGHAREQVSAAAVAAAPEAAIVVQEHQLGTGHAVRMVIESLRVMPG